MLSNRESKQRPDTLNIFLQRLDIDLNRFLKATVWYGHDQEALEFYSQFMGPGDLCFDVGANIGIRTKVFAQIGAQVVAIEPQSRCMKFLRSVYGINRSVQLVEKAVGEQEGAAMLHLSEQWEVSSFVPNWIEWQQQKASGVESVKVTTLDHLITEYGTPTFIKIDVEGFEYHVLRGLSQRVPALSIEYHKHETAMTKISNCLGYLSSLGEMELNYSIGESMRLALPEWVGADRLIDQLFAYGDQYPSYGDVYIKYV
jgi:FkbM family methyltransferase